MALRAKSLFLYGFEITKLNSSLDFRSVSGGPIKLATLRIGFYSLTGLMKEIKRAMEAADPVHIYTITADRTINSGTENRVRISTNGIYLDLLFAGGPRVASSVGPLIGFPVSDLSGATFYVGTSSAGIALIPEFTAYNYTAPTMMRTVFGAVNIATDGTKEAIVWQVQKFFEMSFKYEPEAKVVTEWTDFLTWAVQQKSLEFTPEITSPSLFFDCTLEQTPEDGKGLAFKMKEQLPDFPFNYQTGMLKFRVKEI